MIFESWYWKRELADRISELESWGPRHVQDFKDGFWSGESGFRVERSLFHSAMAIRRLIDSNKVTDRITTKSLTLEAFKATAQGPTLYVLFLGLATFWSGSRWASQNESTCQPTV